MSRGAAPEESGATSVAELTGFEEEIHEEFFPHVEPPSDGSRWIAPTDVEQRLYALSRADNGYAYLRTLALEGVYYPVRLDAAMAQPKCGTGDVPLLTFQVPDGRTVAQVYTGGLLPRTHPFLVYEHTTLGALAYDLPDHVDVLAVNAATPCEQYFSTDSEERDTWLDLHQELFEPTTLADRVVTLRTGGPGPGDLLHGLACGAHLCFQNGDAWNTTHWHGGTGYSGEVDRIADSWGVRGREDWLAMQERLLAREVSPWVWDFVLEARTALHADRADGLVDPSRWRDEVERAVRSGAARQGKHSDGSELTALVCRLRSLVGSVLRYEARFRADGLLPPDGTVRTVAAWDLGRASQMARWGRGARYAAEAEMHTALERVARATRVMYRSWAEFSAGYVLGRCLHFDEEAFGSWYTTVLAAHHELTAHPEGPWRTVPFTAP
ncbi:DUF1266 domain-containing protein [Streptomyces sp. NPDC058171]